MDRSSDRTDQTVETLVAFAASLDFDSLSPEAIWEAKRRVIDSIAIALAGYSEDASVIARGIALASRGTPGATVLGTRHLAIPELATLANGTMVHSQDFMDTYLSKESLHPSDTISAVLAAAESSRVGGRGVILGVVLAYEVMCRLADVANLRERGWDHVVFGVIGSALAAARIMDLTKDQMREALGLAVVSNTALRQTRVGEVPMWKAFAPANAARNGLFAAQLAQMGVTGPVHPFTGEKGFEAQVSGPLRLEPFGDKEHGYMITKTFIKNWPVQYNTQPAIHAALELREKISSAELIDEITVDISETGRILAADTPAKWDPQTRETADHSLPYIVVAALLDGEVTRATFDRERFRNPEKLDLVRRVAVRADPEFTQSYPQLLSVRVAITTRDGRLHSKQIDIPKGHPLDPLTDQELEEKYRRSVEIHLGGPAVRSSLDALWSLETVTDVSDLMGLFEVKSTP